MTAAVLAPRPPMRGIGTGPAWLAWLHAAYSPLHAAGLSDTAAAAELGVSRTAIASARARSGLPRNDGNGVARRKPERSARAAHLGHGNAGRRSFRSEDYGLPAGLYATQTRIVLALANGPLTKAGIAAAAGIAPRSVGSSGIGGRVYWLGDLRTRGLVASVWPGGRRPAVYFLTPAALAALTTPRTESANDANA